MSAKLRKKVVTGNGFWKINAIRPKIEAKQGRARKYENEGNAKRTQSQFSCKKSIPLDLWDVKGNCAKGRSKEALQINRELNNIKAQIIKHYQHLSVKASKRDSPENYFLVFNTNMKILVLQAYCPLELAQPWCAATPIVALRP